MPKSPLRKPVIVYLIALSFIASPFINFWLSTRSLNFKGSVSTLDLIRAIKPEDAALNILIIITGALLLKTHKLTWMLAIFCSALMIIFNVHLLMQADSSTSSAFVTQIWMSLIGTLAGGVVLFYARFPYLDRRDTWTGTATRFAAKIPVEIEGSGTHLIGDVSLTGVRVNLSFPLSLKKDAIIFLKFKEAGSEPLKSRVVAYDDEQTLRVQFLKTSKDYKSFVKKLKNQC